MEAAKADSTLAVAGEKRRKKKEKNTSDSLLMAKKFLDKAIPHLAGVPELQNAKDLREKILSRYIEEERKSLT